MVLIQKSSRGLEDVHVRRVDLQAYDVSEEDTASFVRAERAMELTPCPNEVYSTDARIGVHYFQSGVYRTP